MKNLIAKTSLRIAMGVVVLLSVTTASAETVGRFQVPFQFLMGDKVLPAGDYKVKIDTANMKIQLSSWEGSGSVNLTANTPHRAVTNTGKLVFHKYGRVLALREMWRSGANYGHELTTSKAEREIAERAGAHSTFEIVSIR
jgi:hypothetical protein